MKWNDEGPMTPEKAIKLRGHDIMMKLNAVGVPWKTCNVAALVVALELRKQFINKVNCSKPEFDKAMKAFDALEAGIKGFESMSEEEILKCFVRDIEKASEEATTVPEFKEKVLDIIKNPKTKFKMFI